jgi:hypothetical protein
LGLLAGVGLSAFFWWPALSEMPYVRLDRLHSGDFDFRRHFKPAWQLFSLPVPLDVTAVNPEERFTLGLVQLLAGIPSLLALRYARLRWATVIGWLALGGCVLMMLQESTPLWQAPSLARIVTIVVPLLIAGLAVRAARRLERFDSSFALLMAIGIVLSPVAWQHYLVMAAPALVLLVLRLRELHWPPRSTVAVASLLVAISVPYYWFRLLALRFAVGVSPAGKPIVPALPALLTLTTGVALCALLWFFVKLEPKHLAVSDPATPASLPAVPDALHTSHADAVAL